MATHTPGPWFVHYCDDEESMCMTAITNKNFGLGNTKQFDDESAKHTVAIVFHQCWPCVGAEMNDEENARLIAAAPELLSALEELEKYFVGKYTSYKGTDTEWDSAKFNAEKTASALIKKLKGD
jgi:hypothetical protein